MLRSLIPALRLVSKRGLSVLLLLFFLSFLSCLTAFVVGGLASLVFFVLGHRRKEICVWVRSIELVALGGFCLYGNVV